MVGLVVTALAAVLVGLYAIGTAVCWRYLAGYYAWRIHTTASERSGTKPEPEDWLMGSIPALLIAAVWPAVLYLQRAPFKTKSEREGERLSAKINEERMKLESESTYKELTSGNDNESETLDDVLT